MPSRAAELRCMGAGQCLTESAMPASLARHRRQRRDAAKPSQRPGRRLIVVAGVLVVLVGLGSVVNAAALVRADVRHLVATKWLPRIEPVAPHRFRAKGSGGRARSLIGAAGSRDDVSPRARQSEHRRLCRLVRLQAHGARVLPSAFEPPSSAVRGPTMVPPDQRWRLLATFNAAFVYAQGHNGSTDNGHVNEPLSNGNATLLG